MKDKVHIETEARAASVVTIFDLRNFNRMNAAATASAETDMFTAD